MNTAESWPESTTSHFQIVESTLEDYKDALLGEKVVHWWGDERDNVYLTQTRRSGETLVLNDLDEIGLGPVRAFMAEIGVGYKGLMTQEMLSQRIDDLTRGNAEA